MTNTYFLIAGLCCAIICITVLVMVIFSRRNIKKVSQNATDFSTINNDNSTKSNLSFDAENVEKAKMIIKFWRVIFVVYDSFFILKTYYIDDCGIIQFNPPKKYVIRPDLYILFKADTSGDTQNSENEDLNVGDVAIVSCGKVDAAENEKDVAQLNEIIEIINDILLKIIAGSYDFSGYASRGVEVERIIKLQ